MQLIYARYNKYHNSIDITTFNGYLLRIDCNKAEHGLKVTPNSQCALNALAIDEPLEYARLYLDGEMQAWVDVEDSLVIAFYENSRRSLDGLAGVLLKILSYSG